MATTWCCMNSRTISTRRDWDWRARARTARESLEAWLAELRQQYALFVQAVAQDAPVFLDPYAAEDEAEFFAVATEDFIERPVEFRAANAEHYGLMREFYGIDPAAWREARPGRTQQASVAAAVNGLTNRARWVVRCPVAPHAAPREPSWQAMRPRQ